MGFLGCNWNNISCFNFHFKYLWNNHHGKNKEEEMIETISLTLVVGIMVYLLTVVFIGFTKPGWFKYLFPFYYIDTIRSLFSQRRKK